MSKCVIWEGPIWAQGRYGMDKINGKCMGAHRAAWIRKNGKIPKNINVCHKCDNGLCVNVDHLFLGSQKENMADCFNKGRIRNGNQVGSKNNNAKYNVEEIISKGKYLRNKGLSYQKIADKLGLKSKGHIYNLINK